MRTDPADARALAGLLPYVQEYVAPGRRVLVAPPRYDRVRVGDPLLNVLLDRRNPTRYDVIQPGVVTTAAAQREMVRDLRQTRAVIRWNAPAATRLEANGSAARAACTSSTTRSRATSGPHGASATTRCCCRDDRPAQP